MEGSPLIIVEDAADHATVVEDHIGRRLGSGAAVDRRDLATLRA
jgi:hypothetical protein